MQLIIFDIDGTLLNTSGVDAECFASTFNRQFDVSMPLIDRSSFSASTDSGLLIEAGKLYLSRDLAQSEIEQFKLGFFAVLASRLHGIKNLIVPGATKTFCELKEDPNFDVAIATGAWHQSAIIKLDLIGINYHQVPFSSADDSVERSIIIKSVIEKSKVFYGNYYTKITYVGDRHWDYLAARSLGIDFYGIGNDEHMKNVNTQGKGSADYGNVNPFIYQ